MILTAIILLLSCLCFAISYRFRGLDRAVFYEKGQVNIHPFIKPFVENRHKIDAPGDTLFFGGILFLMCAFFLQVMSHWLCAISIAAIYTLLISVSTSAGYQAWINLAFGLPVVNPKENRKQEIFLFGRSIWIPHLWGKYRVYASFIAAVLILLLTLIIFL